MKDLVSGRHQDMYFKCGEVLISDAVQTDDLNSTKTGDAFQVLRKCGNGFGVEALPFQGYEYAVVRNGVLPARLGFVDKDFCEPHSVGKGGGDGVAPNGRLNMGDTFIVGDQL